MLMNRCERQRRGQEGRDGTFRGTLGVCGYPSWPLMKVTDNIKRNKRPTVGQRTKTTEVKYLFHRVMKKYGAMRPHTSLRRLLVHPRDKIELAEQGELVHQIPRKNCGVEYIGETGRSQLLKTRLDELRKDTDNTNNGKYTRNGIKGLMSNFNKSALTDHAMTENHIIDWEGAKIIGKEPNRRTRQVNHLDDRKTKTQNNKDEGNHELPHVYDDVIHHKY